MIASSVSPMPIHVHMTLEGLALIIGRSQQHDIKCDLKFGHLTAASRKKH